jgi:uncharacterized protein (DUF1697 family)
MAKYAAFLRGMNLGGRRIKNPELCAAVTSIGVTNVEAFLASGNVVFDTTGRPQAIAKKLELGLQKALDYEVPTFVRSAAELTAIVAAEPFAGRDDKSRGKLQIAMLRCAPDKQATAAVLKHETAADWLRVIGQELYWWPAVGLSESELDLARIAKLTGPMTIRTERTIVRLKAKFFA